jgi:hypothetical protein
VTTTEAAVDVEMETRLLSIVTDDTPEQTRRVFHQIAGSQKGADTLDLERWHDLQDWIGEQGETSVYVPFANALADLIPANATRLRRDFGALLNLVRSHAILHQAARESDEDGDLVATVEDDYASVRELVMDVIAEQVGASVTEAMRDTIEAVQTFLDEGSPHVSPKALTDRLGIGRSATYDRIRRALVAGYLLNEANKDERGMKLVIGAPLPGADAFLPAPADVVRAMSGSAAGRQNPHEQKESAALSGSPARPADPPDDKEAESLRRASVWADPEWLGRAPLGELIEHFSEPEEDEVERLAERSRLSQRQRREPLAEPCELCGSSYCPERDGSLCQSRQRDRRPLVVVGDEDYPALVVRALKKGHLTEAEAKDRIVLHRILAPYADDRDGGS